MASGVRLRLPGSRVKTSRRIPQPARAILRYFLSHPNAVESLEGIARWRLLEEAIQRKILETEAALNWLVERGFLTESQPPHSTRLFSLNPESREQAEALVQGPAPEEKQPKD